MDDDAAREGEAPAKLMSILNWAHYVVRPFKDIGQWAHYRKTADFFAL